MPKKSDESIVKQVINGDSDAYGQLMSRYEQKLVRYVVYLIHDTETAKDVVQDTFIKAYQNLNGYSDKYKFSSWIYRIAHNEAMNSIKKGRHLNRDVDVEEAPEASYEPTTSQSIDDAILRDDMKSCIERLPLKYKTIILLQFYENMKYREIADVLRIPTATVGVWSLRAKAKLRQICEQKGVHYEQK